MYFDAIFDPSINPVPSYTFKTLANGKHDLSLATLKIGPLTYPLPIGVIVRLRNPGGSVWRSTEFVVYDKNVVSGYSASLFPAPCKKICGAHTHVLMLISGQTAYINLAK